MIDIEVWRKMTDIETWNYARFLELLNYWQDRLLDERFDELKAFEHLVAVRTNITEIEKELTDVANNISQLTTDMEKKYAEILFEAKEKEN